MNVIALFALVLAQAPLAPPPATAEPLNAIVGDVGFIAAHERAPTAADDEVQRIRDHLAWVVATLRAAPPAFDAPALERRATLLTVLEAYAAAGVFPENHVFATRRPVFIDPFGTRCAVGHLVAHASGAAAAEAIAARHRYAYVLDMHDPALDAWAAENGFSLVELAMIQPAYRPRPPIIPTPIEQPVEPAFPPEALPPTEAFVALSNAVQWRAPDGAMWTRFEHLNSIFIAHIDTSGRLRGIGSTIRTSTMSRFNWKSFYPDGAIMARGAVTNGLAEGAWTFYRGDGSVMHRANFQRQHRVEPPHR